MAFEPTVCFFLLLSSIAVCKYIKTCLFILLLMYIWIVSGFGYYDKS